MSLLGAHFFIFNSAQAETDVGELNQEIEQKRKEIEILQQQIDGYQEQVVIKRKEAKSLGNQVAILENQIAKLELDIEATEKRIEEANLEIQAINIKIKNTEEEITSHKEQVSDFINLIYRNDQVSYLEILLTQNSFSEIFDYFQNTEQLHGDLKKNLDKLKAAKNQLDIQKSNLEEKKTHEEELKDELLSKKSEIDERTIAQELLLVQTRLTQRQYEQYVYQLQLEQQQANADISSIEKQIREELESREAAERFAQFGPAKLAWPVSPARGITAFFHDPDYPFRYLFEHPAIDIRASQGTTIKAPEAGYVARVKFDGSTSYSYVVLVHNDGISTVFGHISKPLVSEDQFVTKGQAVALSGGAPGSVGSGGLTTGAHLHFEVRLDGIPVNPLEYLPPF